ncbi:MAG: DNA-binding protein [Candidatus Omnitrophica bacterium]|nr:DNA-binding protein [Candidatus Omnitrophota bacterium]
MFSRVLTLLILTVTFCPGIALSGGISSEDLIRNARQYDGKLVVYSGEVIGDVMNRGKFAWVNINDGDNAIGIWMSINLAKEIKITGSYKSRGDILEVTGIFNRACLEHGGDLDIHAQAIRKVSNGRVINQRLNIDKRNQSFILLLIIFLTWILTLFKKR